MRDNWSVLENFFLDKFGITTSEAVVDDFINSVVLSAWVFLQVSLGANALGGGVRHAFLGNKSLSLTPVQNPVNVSAFAIVVVKVA